MLCCVYLLCCGTVGGELKSLCLKLELCGNFEFRVTKWFAINSLLFILREYSKLFFSLSLFHLLRSWSQFLIIFPFLQPKINACSARWASWRLTIKTFLCLKGCLTPSNWRFKALSVLDVWWESKVIMPLLELQYTFLKEYFVLLWKHIDKCHTFLKGVALNCMIMLNTSITLPVPRKWKEGEFSGLVLPPRWGAAPYNSSKGSRWNPFEMYFCHWTIMCLKWTSGIFYYLTQKITVGFWKRQVCNSSFSLASPLY